METLSQVFPSPASPQVIVIVFAPAGTVSSSNTFFP